MQVALSTVDNPFDPFTNYDAWNTWDVTAGYHTSQFLARHLALSNDMSDVDYERSIELAVDECVRENVVGVFIKVVKEDNGSITKSVPESL